MRLSSPYQTGQSAGQKEQTENTMWVKVFICVFVGLLADGMDLIFLSFSLGSLVEEFALTPVQAGSLGSISLIGMAIGGFIGGWASDRFGRVHTLVVTIAVFSVGTASLAFTHSYTQFAVLRFVSALGLGAEYVVGNTLMAEYVPTKYRTTVLGALQSGWSVGYVLAAILAGLILPEFGWRYLFAIALIPVVLTWYIRAHIPEPQAWRDAAARCRQASVNSSCDQGKNVKRKSDWRKIAGNPSSRNTFIAWAVTSIFLQFGYFGVNTWLPGYVESELNISFKSMSGYLTCTFAAMIVGKILAGYMADKLGRKVVFAFGGLSTAAFIPVIVFWHSPDNILILLTMFGFFYGVQYGVNATYMTESFNSCIRGLAVGGAYNIGRVGAVFAPVAIGYAAEQHSIGLGLIITGIAYFLCAMIPYFFIREKMFNPQVE